MSPIPLPPHFPHLQTLHKILQTPPSPNASKLPSTHLLRLRDLLTTHLTTLLTAITSPAIQPHPDDHKWRLMLLVPLTYLNRAIIHHRLGYHDLSCADAYRAMLAVDRVVEWRDEEALDDFDEAAELEGSLQHDDSSSPSTGLLFPELQHIYPGELGSGSYTHETTTLSSIAHYQLTHSLILVGCLSPAHKYATTGSSKYPSLKPRFDSLLKRIQDLHTSSYSTSTSTSTSKKRRSPPLPIRGLSRREVYPWNTYEPDRYSPAMLNKINADFARNSLSLSSDPADKGPWCEVRCVELPVLQNTDGESASPIPEKTNKQLGVFALRDIPAGGVYFKEKSALVNCTFQVQGGYEWGNGSWKCEVCTKGINPESRKGEEEEEGEENGDGPVFLECEECEEEDIHTLFCSRKCRDEARKLYHPALCGRRWEWLHREVTKVKEVTVEELLEKKRGEEAEMDGEEVEVEIEEEETEDDSGLYALLLLKAWGMALTQGKHPLEVREVEYLYGAGNRRTRFPEIDGPGGQMGEEWTDSFVPFDFHQDVVIPHMILEELGVGILPSPLAASDEDDDDDEEEEEEEEEEQEPQENSQDSEPTTQPLIALPPSHHPALSITHFDPSLSTLNVLNKFKSVASLTRSINKTVYPPLTTITIAVHPLYSLHNHVCDPNVYWVVNDSGEACFSALSGDQKFWRGGGGGVAGGKWRRCWDGGVRAGEELFSSYVDPGLEVEARRKRIWTTLGGACWCERCVREAASGEKASEDGNGLLPSLSVEKLTEFVFLNVEEISVEC